MLREHKETIWNNPEGQPLYYKFTTWDSITNVLWTIILKTAILHIIVLCALNPVTKIPNASNTKFLGVCG